MKKKPLLDVKDVKDDYARKMLNQIRADLQVLANLGYISTKEETTIIRMIEDGVYELRKN